MLTRFPADPFSGWWYRFWHGYAAAVEDQGGISRPHGDDVLCVPFCERVGHGDGAVQHDAVGEPAAGERGRGGRAGQPGAVRRVLAVAEHQDAVVRRYERAGVARDVGHHGVSALPRPAEQRPAQAGGEPDSVPAAALLPDGLRAAHEQREQRVPPVLRRRADLAAVRLEEHDVRLRPAPRPLPHRRRHLPRQGGDARCGRMHARDPPALRAVLRRVDPQQHHDQRQQRGACRQPHGHHLPR